MVKKQKPIAADRFFLVPTPLCTVKLRNPLLYKISTIVSDCNIRWSYYTKISLNTGFAYIATAKYFLDKLASTLIVSCRKRKNL